MGMSYLREVPYEITGKKIWVCGADGLVGGAICRALDNENCTILRVSKESCDLRNQNSVEAFYQEHQPDCVILAAAKVGGIAANAAYPADFIYDNLMIEANVIRGALAHHVERLVFLGSSCIYPKLCPQPIKEEYLLSGPLEPSNEAYALAKIAGLKMIDGFNKQNCCDFLSVMPCNLFGVGDRYDPLYSHVIPALIMKAHHAKIQNSANLEIWGSGAALREFMDVDDLAEVLVDMLKHYKATGPYNIGSGFEITIKNLAELICEVVGFKGEIVFNSKKLEGTPRKILDTTRLNELGCYSKMCQKYGGKEYFMTGLKNAYIDYLRRFFGDV